MRHSTKKRRGTTPLIKLVNIISKEKHVPADLIMGKDRFAWVMLARKKFCIVAYNDGWSMAAIGEFLGMSDHTSVKNHIDSWREKYSSQIKNS